MRTYCDVAALADYIERNRGQLQGFIRSLATDRLLGVVEIDDLLQEISASAIQSLATAPLAQYTPMQWLQQLARRRIVDTHRFHFDAQRRNAQRQQSIHSTNEDSSSPDIENWLVASMTTPSAVLSQNVRLSRMQQAIEGLSKEQQTVVRLRYVDGLPTKQIAEQLVKSDAAIRVLLSRTMRQLEALLADVRPTR